MHNTLDLEHIQAPPYTPEAKRTRFDEEFKNSDKFYVPEQPQPEEMFSRNTHLEVVANTRTATELATSARDTFIVPQSPEQVAAEQKAYAPAITAEYPNVESLDARRYTKEGAQQEIETVGETMEAVRNAA